MTDPAHRKATIDDFYALPVMRAERGESVRPEPFEAIELVVVTLFGDDPP